MIVDDNKVDIFITTKLLSNSFLAKEILQYTSAEEGLEFLKKNIDKRENLPELIFLDLNMPKMDGFEFIERFNELDKSLIENCKICIVSSSICSYDLHKAKTLREVSEITNKPISFDFIQKLKE